MQLQPMIIQDDTTKTPKVWELGVWGSKQWRGIEPDPIYIPGRNPYKKKKK